MAEDNALTILIPTRNRPKLLTALLRFLRRCGAGHRIVIADSSDPEHAAAVDLNCSALAEIVRFPPAMPVSDKLIAALRLVTTRYVVMLPDDDITFPHAIEASLAFLRGHRDYAAAQGYVLNLGIHGQTFDIAGVRWFTPGIDQDGPVERIYNLVRRYQPFLWALFRTDVIVSAIEAARAMPMIVFQEMTIMNAAAARGKIARLRHVYTLRGMEESLSQLAETHPFYAFLDDSERFFANYRLYRDNLARYIRAHAGEIDLIKSMQTFAAASGQSGPSARVITLEHVLNLIHAISYAGELDRGMLNYTVQRTFGAPLPPIPVEPQWQGWREPQAQDLVRQDKATGQRILWREAVLSAEPRDEIEISADERARVEAQLRHYELG